MTLARLVRRIAYWWRFRAQQDALREELQLHRELVAGDLQRKGLLPEAARNEARRAMGNETLMREEARNVWLSTRLESVIKDWQYACRGLRRSPGFTALVVLTIALTIAANTIVFSVVHRVLLDPLPYPDGNRIVHLATESTKDPLALQYGIGAEVWRQLRARSRTLDEFAAVSIHRYRDTTDPDHPPVTVGAMTASYLSMLRVRPALGRAFVVDDARPGAPPVTMIGFALLQSRYAGAHDVLGRVIPVNGTPRTIVGVVPEQVDIPMSFDETPQLWIPLDLDAAAGAANAYARLRPSATSADATRELQSIVRALPDTDSIAGLRAVAATAQDRIEPRDKRALELLFAAVSGLLLIACANIANLLLMRGWTRQRELAIRLTLGAGRLRLARQLFTESTLLAALGGGLGLVLAWQGLHALIAIYPGGPTLGTLTSLGEVHMDTAVFAWTAAISLATGLLVGVGPAFLSGTRSLGDALRAGAPVMVGNGAARRLRNGLVVVEIAFSLVFLSAAALLVRSFVALARTPIGLDPVGLVTVQVKLAQRPVRANQTMLEQTLIRALRGVPGVTDVAFGGGLAQTDVQGGPFAIDGPSGVEVTDLPFCETPYVGAAYFRVARIPIVEGRTFNAVDPAAASREVVVNRPLARRWWPGGHAVGKRLRVGEGTKWLTVVGVVGDVHLPGTTGDLFNLQMYRPTSAAPRFVNNLVLRVGGGGDGGALEAALRRVLQSAGISAKIGQVWMTESVIDRRVLARPRFAVAIVGAFATIALALCAAGLYGVIAYTVTQRTREIGVRVALGAGPMAVVRLALAESARLVPLGGCLGLLGAWAGTRLLSGFLYQVRPTDPAAMVGAVVLSVAVAMSATLLPVRRALRIDPMNALRAE